MALPTIEMDTRAYGTSVTGLGSYNIPIINAGATVSPGTLKWTGGTVDAAIEIPTSGNIWAPSFWWDTATTDTQICDSTDTPDAATQPAAMFVVHTDDGTPVSFSAPPTFTVYDSSSHTAVEEVIVGTTGHSSSFIKASIGTSYDATVQWPIPQYWDEDNSAAIHAVETGTIAVPASQNSNGNNGLWGSYSYLEASSSDIETNPQYLWMAMSIPSDATTGTNVIDCVFTMSFSYT